MHLSDVGTYPRAKVCLQFSLWGCGAQTCVEGAISATVYIQFSIYYFSFQSVDDSGSFTISPEDTVGMVSWLVLSFFLSSAKLLTAQL